MEENILTCLENFDVLWQRVSPASFLPPPAANTMNANECDLSALWSKSQSLACIYRRLAVQFQGSAATILLRHGNANEGLARRLKAEHFFLSGHCPRSRHEIKCPSGRLLQLRWLYHAEKELSESLTQSSETALDPALAHCLSDLSCGAARRAEENRKLLLRCFGT